jgi:selenocysteine lyase/cysteine desulfurase
MELTEALIDGLRDIPGVAVYGPIEATERTAVVSFTVAGRQVSEIGLRLEEEFEVLCRVGLHCAPAAHRTIGTFPEGTVRLAPGVFTTREDVATVLRGVRKIVES